MAAQYVLHFSPCTSPVASTSSDNPVYFAVSVLYAFAPPMNAVIRIPPPARAAIIPPPTNNFLVLIPVSSYVAC